ncbi:MAG: queuosine precursor transporter [Bacteroidetes bacterium]|nr:queuosine precursor transporter [Bacteroidota bacterium]
MALKLDIFREAAPTRAERLYLLLAGIFLGALVMTNAIAGKFFVFFGQELSCGIIAYPITFLVTDLISELYGRKRATLIVKVGFVVSVFVTAVVWIANATPIYDRSPVTDEAFNMVFGLLPGIVFGSMIAYLTAQFFDVQIFEFWRNLTKGRHLWLRNNGSTILSQVIDSVLVVTIALVIWPEIDANPVTTPLDGETWWGIVIGQYLFKMGIALFDTPFFYVGTAVFQRWIAAEPTSKSVAS